MRLIVGLGNPGEKYENTRHNVGFMAIDELLRKMMPVEKTAWEESKRFNALMANVKDLALVKPLTFMNASGLVVVKAVNFYKIMPEDVWVIHDDLALPLGKIKVRQGGGTGGHRGVESLIARLGVEQFVRFRVGIGHPGPESSNKEIESYVLSKFGPGERPKIRRAIGKTVAAIGVAFKEGLGQAMNRFNV